MKKVSLEEAIVFIVAAALPTYLLRFHLGPIPVTVLEVVELAAISSVIARSVATKQSFRDRFAPLAMTVKNNKLLAIGSALIFLSTIVGIAVAPDKTAALGIAKAYFWEPMALAGLLICAKPDRGRIFRAARYGFAVSAGAIIAYGLVQFAFPQLIPATWTAERRITSVFGFPNAVALYLAPLFPLFLSTPWGYALAALSLLAIVIAKSAGGLIAAASALFALGVIKRKTRLAAIIIALAAGLAVFTLPQTADLRKQILLQDWSGRVHRIGWNESWTMLKDHPFAGAGLSGFPTAVAPYHHAQGVEIFQYPHNLALAIWSELGLLGLFGFALILVWFFRKGITSPLPSPITGEGGKKLYKNIFIVAAIAAMLVHGLVDVPYLKNDLAMMFWLFAAIMAL